MKKKHSGMANKKFGSQEVLVEVPSKKIESEDEESSEGWNYLDLSILALKIILWCLMMLLFISLEFGAVFFTLSIFYIMFTNFRKTKKAPHELSAYSVFNPNCEAIKGTLTAQQFENEIKFGIGGLS